MPLAEQARASVAYRGVERLTGAMNGAATALSWKPSLLRHADLLGLASLAFCFASGLLYKSATRRFAMLSFRGISKRD